MADGRWRKVCIYRTFGVLGLSCWRSVGWRVCWLTLAYAGFVDLVDLTDSMALVLLAVV